MNTTEVCSLLFTVSSVLSLVVFRLQALQRDINLFKNICFHGNLTEIMVTFYWFNFLLRGKTPFYKISISDLI